MNNFLKQTQSLDLFSSAHQELTSNELYQYTAIDISPNLKYLACGGLYIDNIALWDIESLTLLKIISTEASEDIHQLQFNLDSQYLAFCGSSSDLKVWDLQTQQCTILQGHESRIWRICFFNAPQTKILCSGSEDGTVKVWDIVAKQLLQTIFLSGTIYCTISPKNNFLLIAGTDVRLLSWDSNLKQIMRFKIQEEHYCVRYPHHTCLFFAITGTGDHVRIVSKNKLIRKFEFRENWKWEIEFTKKSLLIVSSMHSIKIWNISKGTLLKSIENEFYTYPSMKFQYLEEGICATTVRNLIKLWIK